MHCFDLAPARILTCMGMFSRTSDAKVAGEIASGLNLRIDYQAYVLFIKLEVT